MKCYQRQASGDHQWRWRRNYFFLLGEVGACENSAMWRCTPRIDRSNPHHQTKSDDCRQERRRHSTIFLLQAIWWASGSIPRQRNGGKEKRKRQNAKSCFDFKCGRRSPKRFFCTLTLPKVESVPYATTVPNKPSPNRSKRYTTSTNASHPHHSSFFP